MIRPASRPRLAAPVILSLFALIVLASHASAVIDVPLPLKRVLDTERLIFSAIVDTVAPDKPGVVFKFEEKLKGDSPFERIPVNLSSSDKKAVENNHTKVMLERLAPGRKLIVFASKKGKVYNATGFLEGTWFSMQGAIDADGKTVRWAFQCCEPNLRRTYAGTTAELKKVIQDALAKKADPPELNEKEKPGYGPPVEKKCDIEEISSLPPARGTTQTALFGVIPSIALIGPMALIAALFPGVAASMAVAMKRWRAFLVIASTNSTLAFVYWFLQHQQWLPDTWLAGYKSFTAFLLVLTLVGLIWSGLRYRRLAAEDASLTAIPSRREISILIILTALVGLSVALTRFFGTSWQDTVELPMREFTIIGAGLLVATLYAGFRMATRDSNHAVEESEPALRLSLSGESVGLGILFLGGVVALCLGGNVEHHATAIATQTGDADLAIGPKLADIRVFEIPDAHQVMSNGITIEGEKLFLGAAKVGLSSSYGSVFCIDRNSGMIHWKFDNDEDMNPVFCMPTFHNGKIFVGEGLHKDKACRLFCLDASSGKPSWAKPFETTSHTEGNPRIAHGKVYFTAGDDGLFCADAKTGEKTWQFPGRDQQLHVDGPPAVAGNRVFIGSGLYTLALLAVDAGTGKELWRTPVNLRSFGPPLAIGNRVVYGLGTGNMGADVWKYDEESGKDEEKTAAGAVVCVEADTGKIAWQYDLTRSIHTSLAADAFSVYAASRDGAVHCLDRKTGQLRWKTVVGSTFTSGPAVAASGGMPVAVYAISTEGTMVCLNPQNGKVCWARDLREQTKKQVKEAYTTPTVVMEPTPGGSRRVIYTGAMLENANNGAKSAAVFRFE
ncbi:MAG TPA: PQQ-binding-like beta-propeller repeat protein, partial [Urbifossiella sp.]